MKNKSILNIAMICGCIVSQTNANPLTENEIQLLAEESRFKIQQLEDSLHRVHALQDRETLLARMIGYILIADLAKATNANEVLTAPYMASFIPVDPTRELLDTGLTIGEIDLNQLCYMLKPSEEMGRILRENVVQQPRRNASEHAAYRATLAQYIPSMGFVAPMFLAIRDDRASIPEFDPTIKGLIAFPAEMQSDSVECFTTWYSNIRRKFVETEAESHVAQSFAAFLQHLGLDFLMRHLVSSPGEKNGALSLSLEILKKRYPDTLAGLQEVKRAFANPEILEQYPQNVKEIEQIKKIFQTVIRD
ncbi:MAG: hypothetical protein LBD40_01650 [Puniceicoccales bacterium]|jgi:hypothetical protein|nr:hypothetical protein [Puniceicoccales bacterium]